MGIDQFKHGINRGRRRALESKGKRSQVPDSILCTCELVLQSHISSLEYIVTLSNLTNRSYLKIGSPCLIMDYHPVRST